MAPGELVLEVENLTTAAAGAQALSRMLILTCMRMRSLGLLVLPAMARDPCGCPVRPTWNGFSGTVTLNGKPLPAGNPKGDCRLAGVGRIPEDRHARGVVGEMALWENLISEDVRSDPKSPAAA